MVHVMKDALKLQSEQFKKKELSYKDTIKWQKARIEELEREVGRQIELTQRDHYKSRNQQLEQEKEQLLNIIQRSKVIVVKEPQPSNRATVQEMKAEIAAKQQEMLAEDTRKLQEATIQSEQP